MGLRVDAEVVCWRTVASGRGSFALLCADARPCRHYWLTHALGCFIFMIIEVLAPPQWALGLLLPGYMDLVYRPRDADLEVVHAFG